MSHFKSSGACPNITTLSGLRAPLPNSGAFCIALDPDTGRRINRAVQDPENHPAPYIAEAPQLMMSRNGDPDSGVSALSDLPSWTKGRSMYVFVPDPEYGFMPGPKGNEPQNGLLMEFDPSNALGRKARTSGALSKEGGENIPLAIRKTYLVVRDGMICEPYTEQKDGTNSLTRAISNSLSTYEAADGESLPYIRRQMALLLKNPRVSNGQAAAVELLKEHPTLINAIDADLLDQLMHHPDSAEFAAGLSPDHLRSVATRWRRSGDYEIPDEEFYQWLREYPGSSATLHNIGRGGMKPEHFESYLEVAYEGGAAATRSSDVLQKQISDDLAKLSAAAAELAKRGASMPECGEVAMLLDLNVRTEEGLDALTALGKSNSRQVTADEVAAWRALDMDAGAIRLMREAGVTVELATVCSAHGMPDPRQWKRLSRFEADDVLGAIIERDTQDYEDPRVPLRSLMTKTTKVGRSGGLLEVQQPDEKLLEYLVSQMTSTQALHEPYTR